MIRKILFVLSLFTFCQGVAQLSGTYTIGGTSPDYTTVVTAVAALETHGISGPVTFNIRSGTYDSQSFTLTELTGQSPVNTVTFQSESGNPADVTFTSTNFKFTQGSQYVTVRNIGFSGALRKIFIDGNIYVGNFNISNCIFTHTGTLVPANMSDINYFNQVTQVYVSNGYNIVIDGNTFNNAGVAIYKTGSLTDNFTLSNNTINGGIRPISVYQGKNVVISGNVYTGQILRNALSVTNSVGNLTITGNRFNTVMTTTGTILSSITGNYAAGTNLNFSNNFFCTAKELEINGFADTNIRFNSFSSTTYCLDITTSSGLNAYNIYNNIFKTPYDQPAVKAHMAAPMTPVHSNYNAFSGEAMTFYRYFTGESGSTTFNLTDWRAFSGEDLNSKICGNVFGSEPDLHTPNSLVLSNAGTPVAGITTDIDGQPRNAATPDIGADEFDINPATLRDLGIAIATPSSLCDDSPITVTVTNYSPYAVTGFDIECAINNHRGNFTHYDNTLSSGQSVTLTPTGCGVTPNTLYENYEVNVANPAGSLDNNFANDRAILTNLFEYGPFEISKETSECNGSVKLYVPQFSGATLLWSTGGVTPQITVPGAGTYSVVITDIGGCTVTKSITVN